MTYYSALHYAAKAEKSASEAALHNLKNKITNCITEIPQDIKLELIDNGIRLNIGSTCYMPDGTKYVTSQNASIASQAAQGIVKQLVCLRKSTGGLLVRTLSQCVSGAGVTPLAGGFAYNTTTGKVGYYSSQGVLQYDDCSLPIAIVTTNSSGYITSIDQVFNGFGYIGSTVYALPNVKGLIPNGRNADGSLKNIEFVIEKVKTNTNTTSNDNQWIFYDGYNLQDRAMVNARYYDENENKWYISNGYYSYCHLFTIKRAVGAITSFTPKLPFHAVEYNDAALKQNFQVVSTLPSSPQPDVFYFIPE